MLCYRCGRHVKDGAGKCVSCGQRFDPAQKAGPAAGFGAGIKRPRHAIEGAPCQPGEIIAGRYQIKDHAGAGPLGWMFRAVEVSTDAPVAVKILSPRFVQTAGEKRTFVDGLHKAQRLAHPNIARIYEAGDDSGRPFVAAQLLEGMTLRRIIDLRRQKGQRFTLQEVEPIVAQVAAALDAASAAFAHGNLKPDNVIVLPDLLKLTDFGLAVSLPRAPFMAAQKAAGVHRYLAPEFLLGEPLDARTDVFSLGVMLAEMLSGAQYEAQLSLLEENPQLPESVEALFRSAVSPRPGARYASAGEMAAELSELVAASPRPAPVPVRAAEDAGDVVIIEAFTDPRLRIARALGAARAPDPAPSRPDSSEATADVNRPRRGAGKRGRDKHGRGRRRTSPTGAEIADRAWTSSAAPTEGALAIGPTTPALERIEPEAPQIETPAKPVRPVSQRAPAQPSFGAMEDKRPSRAPLFAAGAVGLALILGGAWNIASSHAAETRAAEAAAQEPAKAEPTRPEPAKLSEPAKVAEPVRQQAIPSRRDGDTARRSMRDRVRAVKDRVEKALEDRRRQRADQGRPRGATRLRRPLREPPQARTGNARDQRRVPLLRRRAARGMKMRVS